MAGQNPPSSKVYQYTFWELSKIGQHAIFVIDGRDYETDQIAFTLASEARKECRRLGVRLAELEVTEQRKTAPRSPLPTWQEYRAALLDSTVEDGTA